ncbi:MAG: hypothetical protein AB8H86_08960 [Polyangiales bacterium]
MRMRAMMTLLCAAACGEAASPASGASPSAVNAAVLSTTMALYLVGGEDDPALFRLGLGARRHQAELVSALEDLDLDEMTRTQRIVVQNDVWGLLERLGPETSVLSRAARAAMARLALPASSFTEAARTLPTQLDGFAERATELPSLQHERAYHLRRLFGLAFRADEHIVELPNTRAIFSRLVVVDDAGARRLTPVVGEIEWLRFEGGELREARVWKMNRRRFALEEVSEVQVVPDHGADFFVFDFGAPTDLSELPCQRCHDEDGLMSLPSLALSLDWRDETLLRDTLDAPSPNPGKAR